LSYFWLNIEKNFPHFQTENFAKIKFTKKTKLLSNKKTFFSTLLLCPSSSFGKDLSMHKTSIWEKENKNKKTSLTCVSELIQAEVIKT